MKKEDEIHRMEPPKKLFGTSGIRGVFGKDLTLEKILEIGVSIGTFYNERGKAIVGWDCRTSSLAITSILTGALLSSGINVEKGGLVTTPAFQKYLQDHKDYDFGVIVTASHNPPEYNGLKLIGRGGLEEEQSKEEKIQKILEEKKFRRIEWNKIGSLTTNNEIPTHYANSLYKHLTEKSKKKKYKIVFDYANCASIKTIPIFLQKLINVKYISLNSDIDGMFRNRPSEPRPENILETRSIVEKIGADFGVAFDGDGDRALIVDEMGNAWWGDAVGTLIAKYLLDYDIPIVSVVTPVTSSSLVEIILEPLGVKIYRTKVGAKNIVYKMRKVGAVIGFEENGGVIFAPHVFTRDGGITTVLIMNILSFYNKKLSKLFQDFPKLFQLKDKIRITDKIKVNDVLIQAEDKLAKDAYRIEKIDGIKIFYDIDKWILIRPSGTEPVIRIFVEAHSSEEANHLIKIAEDTILNLLK